MLGGNIGRVILAIEAKRTKSFADGINVTVFLLRN